MSILIMDGFDQNLLNSSDGGNLGRRWSGLTSYISSSGGPWGDGRALAATASISSGTEEGSRTIATSSTVIVGLWIKFTTFSSAFPIRLRDSGTNQITLELTTSGTVSVRRGGTSGTVLGTSAACFGTANNGLWYRVEMKVTIHGSTGTVEVRVDGAAVISLTGQNTQATGNASVNQVVLSVESASSNSYFLDDLYVLDTNSPGPTDFLGDWRVRTLQPTGAGSSAQWTGVPSGTTWDRVNDIPPSATDAIYVSSTTNGHVDLHAMADVPTTVAGIKAVAHSIQTRSDDGSPTGTVRSKLKSGSTTSNGTTVTLTSSYQHQTNIYHSNPDTSTDWTATTVNALEAGYEKVS